MIEVNVRFIIKKMDECLKDYQNQYINNLLILLPTGSVNIANSNSSHQQIIEALYKLCHNPKHIDEME